MSNIKGNPTKKQKDILDFVDNYIRNNNISPSFTDIAKALKISTGTVRDQLFLLQKKGLLLWTPNAKRSIRIRSQDNFSPDVPVPLLGTISAGEGINIFENSDPEIIDVPGNIISTGFGHYCLKVAGYSMAQDGILDGDIIVVRQQASASDGDNVVAVLKGQTEERATLKKFYHHGNEIELRPRNQQLESKFYNPSEIEVRGKFIGLIRKN